MDHAAQWKTKLKPLAGPRWPLRCGHVLSPEELKRLREGFWPRHMEDRWAIWLDGNILRCWHSRTNTCIYEADITLSTDGSGVVAVLDVLDDNPAYQRASTDSAELDRFEGVLSLAWRREDETSEPTDDDARLVL